MDGQIVIIILKIGQHSITVFTMSFANSIRNSRAFGLNQNFCSRRGHVYFTLISPILPTDLCVLIFHDPIVVSSWNLAIVVAPVAYSHPTTFESSSPN